MDTDFAQFIAGAALVSLSGVMAPGPLSAVTVGKGSRSPHAGIFIAIGHGMVELPLMAAVFFGFGYVLAFPGVRPALGMAGGAVLLFMAIGMFRSLRGSAITAVSDSRSPLGAGVVLTAANPYFLLWWATVGASMVMGAAVFGPAGVAVFMAVHWLCDFGWSWALSVLSYRGGRFFGNRFQKAVCAVSGALLLIFSGIFIHQAVMSLF
ncbi:MAG TPA: LysE family transporter [Spirochaetota bacterium]|nr:LysE family transporter [Spirochaetota bacterium]HPC40645.1 LysE family transporter [Spirochaetota bacterium]HPL18252.1 LysE family transporter [Spirochaetota bacterium]HQF10244.1 LysE family transporter [Spirochaetota bacterium]HQH99122.1 LysE family transporter [Spirochaetota bacterium]